MVLGLGQVLGSQLWPLSPLLLCFRWPLSEASERRTSAIVSLAHPPWEFPFSVCAICQGNTWCFFISLSIHLCFPRKASSSCIINLLLWTAGSQTFLPKGSSLQKHFKQDRASWASDFRQVWGWKGILLEDGKITDPFFFFFFCGSQRVGSLTYR